MSSILPEDDTKSPMWLCVYREQLPVLKNFHVLEKNGKNDRIPEFIEFQVHL